WRTRRPAPYSGFSRHPEIAFAVLVQSDHSFAQATRPVALGLPALDCAEPPGRENAKPDRSLAILQEQADDLAGNFWILCELAVLPARQAFQRLNPESPVAPDQEVSDVIAGELLTGRRPP